MGSRLTAMSATIWFAERPRPTLRSPYSPPKTGRAEGLCWSGDTLLPPLTIPVTGGGWRNKPISEPVWQSFCSANRFTLSKNAYTTRALPEVGSQILFYKEFSHLIFRAGERLTNLDRHCERSAAIQRHQKLDCFAPLAMTDVERQLPELRRSPDRVNGRTIFGNGDGVTMFHQAFNEQLDCDRNLSDGLFCGVTMCAAVLQVGNVCYPAIVFDAPKYVEVIARDH
jgi:hypothetical protein